MANYKIPPDPRKSDNKQSLSQSQQSREPIPWLYVGLGFLVTIIGVGFALLLARTLLNRPPLPLSEGVPTIIVLTAPPNMAPSATPNVVTPTAVPTLTPIPTPNNAIAPDDITVGFYAQVANTDGFGVTIRGGPSTSNVPLLVADEGTVLLVIDGPEEAGDFLWWQVQLDDGTEGWAAGSFLIPAAAP